MSNTADAMHKKRLRKTRTQLVGDLEVMEARIADRESALQQHGGDVEVFATEGHGTLYLLWLPLSEESEVAV